MSQYIIRRLLLAIPTVIGASLLIFVVLRVVPGDVAEILAGGGGEAQRATLERVELLRKELRLDRPIHEQYALWVADFFQGKWGVSLWTHQQVTELLAARYPVTLQVAVMAIIMSLIIAIPLGIVSAVKQDTAADYIARLFAIIGLAIPHFWLGILILYFLAKYSGWIPPITFVSPFKDPLGNLSQFIFPAIVVGTAQAAVAARMTRSSMLEVLREDYIRTARAKGLKERLVISRHALKNALIPVVTITGLQIAHLIGGTMVTEVVFNVPGMGQAMVEAVQLRDYPVVQALVLVITLGYVFVNLLVDLLYSWLDPRVQYH